MFYGLSDLPWWGYIVATLIMTHITICSVTIYLHRCQAHRAIDVHPALAHFFRCWLWLTTGMVTKEWASVHRKHHAKCETIDDPHSPQVLSLPLVLWRGAELYRRESANKETLERYGQGTPDDALETFYQQNSKLGIKIMFAFNVLVFGVPGVAIWAIQMGWIPFFAAGVINGVGHFWGYRNFECPDQARNISPLGIFLGGEELHNNHHTYPTSAKFSVKPWEFDVAWLYIKVFQFFKLITVKRVVPEPNLIPGKTQIDIETLKAIILNRFQVMACYSREVLVPAFRSQGNEDESLKPIQTLLVRESSLLDITAKQRLTQFLEDHQPIQVAYQFKERLQNLWAQTNLKEKELLEALQKWCQEAEATGIKALEDFAAYLKSFTLQAA